MLNPKELHKNHGGVLYKLELLGEISRGSTVPIQVTFYNPYKNKVLLSTFNIKEIKKDKSRTPPISPYTRDKDKIWFPSSGTSRIILPETRSVILLPLIIFQDVDAGEYKITSFIFTQSTDMKADSSEYTFKKEVKHFIPESLIHINFSITQNIVLINPVQKFLSITPFKLKLEEFFPLLIQMVPRTMYCYLRSFDENLFVILKLQIVVPEKLDEIFHNNVTAIKPESIEKADKRIFNNLEYTVLKIQKQLIEGNEIMPILYFTLIKNRNAIVTLEFQQSEGFSENKSVEIMNNLGFV